MDSKSDQKQLYRDIERTLVLSITLLKDYNVMMGNLLSFLKEETFFDHTNDFTFIDEMSNPVVENLIGYWESMKKCYHTGS